MVHTHMHTYTRAHITVIQLFSKMNLRWPSNVDEGFTVFSFFNFDIDLLAVECSFGEVDFRDKWLIVVLLPCMLGLLFLVIYIVLHITKRIMVHIGHEKVCGISVCKVPTCIAYVCVYVCVCVCISVYIYVCVCVCVYVYVYVYLCMYMYVYVYVCVCVSVYMYVYV